MRYDRRVQNQCVQGHIYRKGRYVIKQCTEMYFIMMKSSFKIHNNITLHYMYTVLSFFSALFVSFWESHCLNLIQVWKFPKYLRLSLPSGLPPTMSYMMQPDKQYACTESINVTQRGTRATCTYTHTHHYILEGFMIRRPHFTALQKPSTPNHTCSATRLSM